MTEIPETFRSEQRPDAERMISQLSTSLSMADKKIAEMETKLAKVRELLNQGTFRIPERPIEKARNRVVEAAKAYVLNGRPDAPDDAALTAAVAELERLEAEAQS